MKVRLLREKDHWKPKFKVGNTIRHKKENDSFKVLAIEDDCYKLENNIVVSIAAQDSWELVEEPVSEDLDKAAGNYAFTMSGEDEVSKYYAFLAGAKWKEEQFEKNRLAACDKQTEKEAEIESDFVMGIIENEHRQPTFDDAIKYGMRLQKEQMIEDAFEREVKVDAGGYPYIPQMELYDYDNDIPLAKEGDKYKVILIKED